MAIWSILCDSRKIMSLFTKVLTYWLPFDGFIGCQQIMDNNFGKGGHARPVHEILPVKSQGVSMAQTRDRLRATLMLLSVSSAHTYLGSNVLLLNLMTSPFMGLKGDVTMSSGTLQLVITSLPHG